MYSTSDVGFSIPNGHVSKVKQNGRFLSSADLQHIFIEKINQTSVLYVCIQKGSQ